jgi:RNA polymerase primary sigma factor
VFYEHIKLEFKICLMSKNFVSNYGEDCMGKYFNDVRNSSELLTPEEEVLIANRIKEGDTKAIDELVKANLKFVISIAKEYQNQGLGLNDLINEGNYGLIKAAVRFDATRGFRFISYAVWWIKQSIIQSLNDNARMIRLPANVISKLSKIKKELEKFEFNNEREAYIGEVLNDDNDEDDLVVMSTPTVNSLNSKINEDGSELYEMIEDPSNEESDYFIDTKVKEELDRILSVLNERERNIIQCYFGVNTETESMTLEDIGDKYGLTKERIRQIKEKTIRKIRHHSNFLFELLKD